MKSVYFLGAGSSAESGYPITRSLTYAIASYLVRYRRNNSDRANRLEQYMHAVYGTMPDQLTAASRSWDQFVSLRDSPYLQLPESIPIPGIIDVLTILDVTINEGRSFGPAQTLEKGRKRPREFKGNELKRVRDRLIESLALAFEDLAAARPPSASVEKLIARLAAEDVLITTNWDTLVDRALIHGGRLPAYGSLVARLVDASGNDLVHQPKPRQSLLKLHGSLNWLYCARCADLYINTESMIAPIEDVRGWHLDRDCDCGAELDGLIVTPSFIKEYSNPHLVGIWQVAQKALETADQWVFIGYSLPDDDFWVRAMLLRAVAIKRAMRAGLAVQVVSHASDDGLVKRYERMFGDRVTFCDEGFGGWLEHT